MKEIEITCIDCKKKEIRKPQTTRCYACAFKKAGSYHKTKPKIKKKCPICLCLFPDTKDSIKEVCSPVCAKEKRNLEINSHWQDRKLELKYKRKAINDFSTPINQNMQILDDFDYSRQPDISKKAPTQKAWKHHFDL